MQHNFDVEIAKQFGILEAILLEHIYFWIEKNKANDKHYYNNEYWTYNSRKAFSEIFPYATERQIRTALEKLEKNEMIKTGNFNKVGFDKTLWYAITAKGYSKLQKCQIDLAQELNEYKLEVKSKADIEENNSSNELADDFEKIWLLYPRKEAKNTAFNHYKAWLKGKKYAGKIVKLTNRQMWFATKKYADSIEKNKIEKQFIKMGSTFFNEAIMDYVEEEKNE